MKNWKLVDLTVHGDERGNLVAIEKGHGIDFDIKRVYYIWGSQKDVVRGKHLHKSLEQLIICISGSCDFILRSGDEEQKVRLDNPSKTLYIGNNVWREFTNFSQDCVVMVLASEVYCKDDYVKHIDFVDYDQNFLNLSWKWLNDFEVKSLTDTPDFTKYQQSEWFRGLALKSDYFIKGVLFDNIKVGVVGLKNITNFSGEYWGYIGEKSFWGMGIGKSMVFYIVNYAKKIGLNEVFLKVLKNNLRAINLYEKMGFSIFKSDKKNYFMRIYVGR